MISEKKNHVYALAPLLKKTEWEIDVLKLEFQTLSEFLRRVEEEITGIAGTIGNTEKILREMQMGEISIDKKQQADGFFRHQHHLMREAGEEFAKLKANCENVLRQLNEKKQSLKVLEKHKNKKLRIEKLHDGRRSLAESDSNWLLQIARERIA